MYIFTDAYPWGRGEKTFIDPELMALRDVYDITIASIASDEDASDMLNKSDMPSDIEAIRWQRPSVLAFCIHAMGFFFSKAGRGELRDLFHDGFTFARLVDSIRTYGIARTLLSHYKKIGLFAYEDAIYYSFWFSYQMLALALEKSECPINLVSRIHGYDLYNARNKHGRQPFQRYKKKMADLIIFASSNARDDFAKEFGKESHPGQYVVNRLGVSGQPGIIQESVNHDKLIVSCSNVIPLKRVDLIAKAIACSPNADRIRWIHFGDGPALREVKRIAHAEGINATFFGHTSNKKIIEFYGNNHVDAAILLSETEGGCPVCFQEALSFGIPLIGTDVGGISEEIDGNGVLLEANPSLDGIAEAIDRVCFADDGEVSRMRRRSLEIWEENFDASKNKDELLSALSRSSHPIIETQLQ